MVSLQVTGEIIVVIMEISDEPIILSLNNLVVGNYTFRFEASDGWGESVSNEVLVIVTRGDAWVDPLIKALIGLAVATAPVIITTAIILVIKRRNATNEI